MARSSKPKERAKPHLKVREKVKAKVMGQRKANKPPLKAKASPSREKVNPSKAKAMVNP